MKEETERKFQEAFPILYKDLYGDMRATCMAWGFECDEGWHDLLWKLSEDLTAEINKLPEEDRDMYRASQVKEKYGTLRFYMNTSTDEMDKLIDKAEDISGVTCEKCGKPGTLGGKSWLATRCEEHKK